MPTARCPAVRARGDGGLCLQPLYHETLDAVYIKGRKRAVLLPFLTGSFAIGCFRKSLCFSNGTAAFIPQRRFCFAPHTGQNGAVYHKVWRGVYLQALREQLIAECAALTACVLNYVMHARACVRARVEYEASAIIAHTRASKLHYTTWRTKEKVIQ